MKKKPVFITVSLFLFGIMLFTVYYFAYVKNVITYDLVNIEFSGLTTEEAGNIKISGITPCNKITSIQTSVQDDWGSFEFIEMLIPDTLVSKIISIRIVLKSKVYKLKTGDLVPNRTSEYGYSCRLPKEVASTGTFFNRLFTGYPFNIAASSLFISFLSLIIFIILLVIFVKMAWTGPKKYIRILIIQIKEKRFIYVLLFIALIILLMVPIHGIIKPLIILFYFLFSLQTALLLGRSYTFYIIRTVVIIFLCFELIFGFLNSKKIITQTLGDGKYITREKFAMFDPKLGGYRLLPNCYRKRATEILNGDTVYDVYYSSDNYGRRIPEEEFFSSPNITKNTKKNKHAIFLGCSHTFGEGLACSSSFPYMFEINNPVYKSYNYGFSSWGPHQMALLFDEGINTLNNISVPEDSGFCLYSYIDDHMNRVYGGSTYLDFAGRTPDVYVIENKLITTPRSYFQRFLGIFLFNSETMRYFNVTFSYPKREHFYRRFADLINYSAKKYWDIKPHGNFYVGLYEYIWSADRDYSWLQYLDKKIKVIYVTTLPDINSNPIYKIQGDGHPSKVLNAYYLTEISKSIVK